MPFDFFMSRYKEAYVLETLVRATVLGLGVRARVNGLALAPPYTSPLTL